MIATSSSARAPLAHHSQRPAAPLLPQQTSSSLLVTGSFGSLTKCILQSVLCGLSLGVFVQHFVYMNIGTWVRLLITPPTKLLNSHDRFYHKPLRQLQVNISGSPTIPAIYAMHKDAKAAPSPAEDGEDALGAAVALLVLGSA